MSFEITSWEVILPRTFLCDFLTVSPSKCVTNMRLVIALIFLRDWCRTSLAFHLETDFQFAEMKCFTIKGY